MINLNGILYAILIGIVFGAAGGYFVGKKYGGGYGTLAGFGITLLIAFLLVWCKPCQEMLRGNSNTVKSNVPKNQ